MTKRLKLFKIEVELVVRDPDAVITAAKDLMSPEDWKQRVSEDAQDGEGPDELFVAMDTLFNSNWIIPDKLADAVEFYAGSSDIGRDVPEDWYKR